MLVTFVVFCVCLFVALTALLLYLHRGTSKNPTESVPSLEPRDDKKGNMADIQEAGGFELFLDKLHKEWGPVAGFWYGADTYVVSVGQGSLLKSIGHLFNRPPELFEMVKPIIGPNAIQVANNGNAKARWQAYTEAMSGKSVQNKLPDLVNIAKEFAVALRGMPKDDHALLQNLMLALAMKMLSRTQMGCYFEDDEKIGRFHSQYDSMNEAMLEILNGAKAADTTWARDIADMQQTIREALAAYKADRASGDYQDAPLLSAIIDNTYDDEEGESSSSVIGQELGDVITLVIGGYHTTGYGLTWVLHYMSLHQGVQDKVRAEIIKVLGHDRDLSTTDEMRQLVYTRQVVDETLRLTRLASFAARTSDRDERLGGHLIPAGIVILAAIHVICHDPEVFPDPDQFDPDRFSPEASKMRPNTSFPMFGFGSRRCPGYNWAYAEIITALSVIVRQFRILPVGDSEDVGHAHGVVTKPDRDIWVRFNPID